EVLPLEQQADGPQHLGLADDHDLVDITPSQLEREWTWGGCGEPIRDRVDAFQSHDVTSGDRPVHRVRAGGLDAQHANSRSPLLDVERDAPDQPTAPNGDNNRVDILHRVEDLQADRP